jgi:hypothetical protein
MELGADTRGGWGRYAPSRKVVGSVPDEVAGFFNCPSSSDRLWGLVVRVPGYTTEMYCVSCEVRIEFVLCYVQESRQPLWSSSWLQNGDVLCFLWGKNWIYICYVDKGRPPLWSSGQSSWLLNGDVLCFLWGTNWIYICYVEESKPPPSSDGQSSWLQIQRSGFGSQRYQIFWEAMGLEQGPLSLVSTIEELLERKSSGSGLEIRGCGRRDPSRWPRVTLYPLGRYSSLADSGHGIYFSLVLPVTLCPWGRLNF